MNKILTFEKVIGDLSAYGTKVIEGLKGRGWKDEDELPFDSIVRCYSLGISTWRCANIIHKLRLMKD